MNADCDAVRNCSLPAALAALHLETVRGQPAVIHLANGTYDMGLFEEAPTINLSSTAASEIWIVGDGGAVVRGIPYIPLFFLDHRTPRFHLRNLIIHGQVLVTGGDLQLKSCVFEGSRSDQGGAIEMRSGRMDAEDSTFENNTANSGGAVHQSGGDAIFSGCTFVRNVALEEQGGGAFNVLGGVVEFKRRSTLHDNKASSTEESLYVASDAEVKYWLPTPLGFWVESLGLDHAVLETGSTKYMPLPCAAGMKGGSSDQDAQSSALCHGYCDAGVYCGPATVTPEPCSEGSFCQLGSPAPRPCQAGTYQPHRGQTSCIGCTPGNSCPAGSTSQEPCKPGWYGDASDWACQLCSGGKYQPNTTQTSCEPCPSGSMCPAGSAIPTHCTPGTFAAQDEQARCAKCGAGKFQGAEGATDCKLCPKGSHCGLTGLAAPILCPPGV